MQLTTSRLNVTRLEKHLASHYEIKDPSIIQLKDGCYMMFASIGNSLRQEWLVGRFIAADLAGQWQELEPVKFVDIAGPQLCAPAVTYQVVANQEVYGMYIQSACFEENGSILYAQSSDGQTFVGQPQPLVTRDLVNSSDKPIVGVYDVGISEIKVNDEELICMLYSGYRSVGCGDIYLSYRNKKQSVIEWTRGERLLAQEEVPFHNRPDYEFFEWGLEGAKMIQLADDCFLIIGVCFMPKSNEHLGTRQRVFMAAATTMNGPYQPIGFPFVPSDEENHRGENGHPDTIIEGQSLQVIYQERGGKDQPWYLRFGSFDLTLLKAFLRGKLDTPHEPGAVLPAHLTVEPESYHFLYN